MSEETTTPEVVAETTEETAAPEAVVEEVKEEAPAVEEVAAEEEAEVPAEFVALIDQVEKMSVLELHKLVKVLEKKFGVSAAAVAVAGGPAAGAAEEQSSFDVILTSDGGSKIPVMKAVKTILDLGLKEAKELVEGLPADIKKGVKKEEAEAIKAAIEEAGGKVEIK